MIIIAGTLRIAPADRDAYLAAASRATALAREAPGCHDFAQSPDPLEADRINIYERWETDADLEAFRALPDDGQPTPPIQSGEVARYRISAVQAP